MRPPSLPIRTALFMACLMLSVSAAAPAARDYFKITVVDDATGRGVPLVELRTTNEVRYYTDSSGIVAFDDEGLMGQKVFFAVTSHGYVYPKDGFGYRGIALQTTRGGSAVVKIHRDNVAERLYRITGEGIYRDSMRVGQPVPLKEPLLNGKVMGQDTVEVVPYRGKLYWFWGDTGRPGYPLGNFHTSGATSLLTAGGGLDPDLGIDLKYFVDADGFCRAMLPRPDPGPVWIGGLTTVSDDRGRERLIANWARMKNLGEVNERGLAVFDDDQAIFVPEISLDRSAPRCPLGHPFHASSGGAEYVYSAVTDGDPFPCVRVPADLKHVTDAGAYETFTCLVPGARYDKGASRLDRGPDGRLSYGWKAGTDPVGIKGQQELIRDGKMKPEEALIQLRDVATGKAIQTAGGSVYWNAYRRRWVLICGQFGGTSLLGEIWYAEGDTPVGPWVYATKIVTHDRYSFYNPTQHPFFDQDGGRRIYFEGTYTRTFSDNQDPTPRYDYNQIMYRLSLDDPRLALPCPVYRLRGASGAERYDLKEGVDAAGAWERIAGIPFFAVPGGRKRDGLIPIYSAGDARGSTLQRGRPAAGSSDPVFYALPAEVSKTEAASADTGPLYDYRDDRAGAHLYSMDPDLRDATLKRAAEPLCRVWRSPNASVILDYRTKPIDVVH